MDVKNATNQLVLDDAPMEQVFFDSVKKILRMTLETEQGDYVNLVFSLVAGFQYQPTVLVDRRDLYVGGEYVRSLLVIEGSEWLKQLHSKEEAQFEPVSEKLKHFVVPSDEGVWEIFAENWEFEAEKQ